MKRLAAVLTLIGCSSSSASPPAVDGGPAEGGEVDSASDAGALTADWVIAVDPSATSGKISPALLGHYDLSGALFRYDKVPGLATALQPIGWNEWRVGLGRWEASTLLLPTLTDGTPCTPSPAFPPEAFAKPGTTDLDLIAARDWFVDDGQPVTTAMTSIDARYALAYVRSVLDVAKALGAQPYVGIDHMPRALAANRTPSRTIAAWADACNWTWTNKVSNVAPADPLVFAAAAAGMVKRVVEGSGGEPPRLAPYWEIWNEPELAYAWDPSFDDGKLTKFFTMAIDSLVALDAYRKGSPNPAAKGLHFGFGSFANAGTAAAVIGALEQGTTLVPVDFFSFHSYDNDPLKIVLDIEKVVAARAASARYKGAELALSEWGPNLANTVDPTTMDAPLLMSTVVALGATAGLDRAHHTFFYDFYSIIPWGLVNHAVQPKPLYHAYELLSLVVAGGAERVAVAGAADGRLDAGMGAVLASRDANGKVRVLLINRGAQPRSARVDVAGVAHAPSRVLSFDDPTAGVHSATAETIVTVPPRSIVLIEL